MYGMVLMMAMSNAAAGPGWHGWHGHGGGLGCVNGVCGAWGWGWFGGGWWWPLPPGQGYGALVPKVNTCCGVVLPPLPPTEWTTKTELRVWKEYVDALEGAEKHEMMALWMRSDVAGRRCLLHRLGVLRQKVKEEREKEENEPLSEEEQARWDAYLKRLPDDARKKAEQEWNNASNKQRRQMLEKIGKDTDVDTDSSRRRAALVPVVQQ